MVIKNKKRKGFTLIETLIAVFIFSLAMTMLSGTFSSLLRNFANAKKTQKNFENASYALSLMAKALRTSTVISDLSSTPNKIRIYDFSQSKCIEYKMVASGSSNKIQTSFALTDAASCTGSTSLTFGPEDLTTDDIQSLAFSGAASGTGTHGKVTVAIALKETGQTSGALPIQTTVSLRQ